MARSEAIDATYILPIRRAEATAFRELAGYLNWLHRYVEVIVVDSSAPAVFGHHERYLFGVHHMRPDERFRCLNGKVWNVLTGLDRASHDRIVIADDDVRYDLDSLRRVVGLLDEAEVVRPQNYFEPLPWHAAWDTARSLLNRVTGGDWPGTLAVRRSFLNYTKGYDGNVLFENLELVRTVRAVGGREIVASEVYVRRLPSTFRHFISQRVRQAYDEFARPRRLVAQLALLPGVAILLLIGRRSWLAALTIASIGLAEAGRRRNGGTAHFPFVASLMAPFWLTERAVCSWLALASRLRLGGVRYAGGVIEKAASSERQIETRLEAVA